MFGNKNKALLFIFITMLLDVVGLGIIIPVLPKLIAELVNSNLSEASSWGGILMGTYAAMQFLFAPVIGGLSDSFGRRPVLLASLFAFGLDYILLGFATNIGWLFVGRLIAGITGASYSTATAYISDISEPDKKAQNFGLIGAAFGLGFILGPILGGIMGSFGSRIPFFASAALSLMNCIYGYFVLPESLPDKDRRAFDIKRANPFGSLIQLRKYPKIVGLVLCLFIVYVAGHANQSSWVYITMEKFNWDEKMVGLSLGWVGLTVGLVQGGLSRIIIPKIGQVQSVYIGLLIAFVGYFLFAFATQGWMMFAIMTFFAFSGIAMPSIQSIISNQVPKNEQGEVQGTLTSLISLSSIIGPLLMNNLLFHYFSNEETFCYFPGAPFLMAGILVLISIFIAFRNLTFHHS